MKTEKFSLASPTDVWKKNGIIRVLKYDEGDAGGALPLIRVTSMSGSDIDVEMKPGRLINLREPINGLVISNLSGAPLTGKFTFGDGGVEDNTFSGSFDLTTATINALINAKYNTRPEAPGASFVNAAAVTVNAPITVFAPGLNTNGAIVYAAEIAWADAANSPTQVFLSKSGIAPASVDDGAILLASALVVSVSGNYVGAGRLPQSQFVSAGEGLYFISNNTMGLSTLNRRSCRYRLL